MWRCPLCGTPFFHGYLAPGSKLEVRCQRRRCIGHKKFRVIEARGVAGEDFNGRAGACLVRNEAAGESRGANGIPGVAEQQQKEIAR